mmetsp:Transcript_18848/g.60526  ORF Transcript_18848/g.60526 Transcript_18848/m.60526 type:complete len:265 (-) Transcript_18848:784-1578(-)
MRGDRPEEYQLPRPGPSQVGQDGARDDHGHPHRGQEVQRGRVPVGGDDWGRHRGVCLLQGVLQGHEQARRPQRAPRVHALRHQPHAGRVHQCVPGQDQGALARHLPAADDVLDQLLVRGVLRSLHVRGDHHRRRCHRLLRRAPRGDGGHRPFLLLRLGGAAVHLLHHRGLRVAGGGGDHHHAQVLQHPAERAVEQEPAHRPPVGGRGRGVPGAIVQHLPQAERRQEQEGSRQTSLGVVRAGWTSANDVLGSKSPFLTPTRKGGP